MQTQAVRETYRVFESLTTNPHFSAEASTASVGPSWSAAFSFPFFVGDGEKKCSSLRWLASSLLLVGVEAFLEVSGPGGRVEVEAAAAISRRSISSMTPKTRNGPTKPTTGISRCQRGISLGRSAEARKDSQRGQSR